MTQIKMQVVWGINKQAVWYDYLFKVIDMIVIFL